MDLEELTLLDDSLFLAAWEGCSPAIIPDEVYNDQGTVDIADGVVTANEEAIFDAMSNDEKTLFLMDDQRNDDGVVTVKEEGSFDDMSNDDEISFLMDNQRNFDGVVTANEESIFDAMTDDDKTLFLMDDQRNDDGVVTANEERSFDVRTNDDRTLFLLDNERNIAAVHVDGVKPESLRKIKGGCHHILRVKLKEDGEFDLEPICQAAKEGLKRHFGEENLVNKNWFTKRERTSSYKRLGHSWKRGGWSVEETETLQKNVKTYCEKHDLKDPSEIIFNMKDQRQDFYKVVANGINRPLFAIYRRVKRMYDNKNYVGKYNSTELQRLRELRGRHGNDWQKIGSELGRSASSIRDKCRLIQEHCRNGKWLPDEEDRLTRAVYDFTNTIPGERVSSGISWSHVAEKVGTRSDKQCRMKWLKNLNWKHSGGSEWTKDDEVKLLERLKCVNVSEESEIDWSELAKGWLAARSPQWLRAKWMELKKQLKDLQNFPFRATTQTYSAASQTVVKEEPEDLSTSILQVPLLLKVLPSTIIFGYPVSSQADSISSNQEVFTPALPNDALRCNENVTIQQNPAPLMLSSSENSLLMQTAEGEFEDLLSNAGIEDINVEGKGV